MKNIASLFCLHTCLFMFSFWTIYPVLGHAADGDIISQLKFKLISTLDGLPTDEVNPEKPDVPLNKNDAFQKVQKRRVQEKR